MADLKMPDLNRVIIAGRLTRDPELKYIPSGTAVCELGMAVSRKYRTKDGEQREDTLFINVETWAKTAEFCGEYLKKGAPIIVEGSLKMDSWEDKTSGQKRTAIKVRADRIQQMSWEDRDGRASTPAPRPIEEPVPEDDIPF